MSNACSSTPVLLRIGRIVRSRGREDELLVELERRADGPEPGNVWTLITPRRSLNLTVVNAAPEPKGGFWRVRFEEVRTREQAGALRGQILHEEVPVGTMLSPERVAPLAVVGWRVTADDGTPLGAVSGVMQAGANPVLEVRGEKKFGLPWAEAFVAELRPDGGLIRLTAKGRLLTEETQ